MKPQPRLYLASASPRRHELIRFIHPEPAIVSSSYEEPPFPELLPQPAKAVKSLALQKALHSQLPKNASGWVLGADTLVWLDGCPFGKPASRKAAYTTISALSGREHRVYTGLALVPCLRGTAQPVGSKTTHAITHVRFRTLTPAEINAYLNYMEWTDKAGGYGAQGAAMSLLASVRGCWTNVVGLPVETTLNFWRRTAIGKTMNESV